MSLGISMVIHPDSRLEGSFAEEKQDALLTALGNVIENALESVKQKEDGQRKVAIFLRISERIVFLRLKILVQVWPRRISPHF